MLTLCKPAFFTKIGAKAARLLGFALILSCFQAHAVLIQGTVISLGNNSYQIDYLVENNDRSEGVVGISIIYDYSVFASITDNSDSSVLTDWDVLLFQPSQAGSQDGVFDAYGLYPLALNDVVSGFSVVVELFSNTLFPTTQMFDIYDDNFDVIFSATANLYKDDTHPIPEPPPLYLFIGLLLIQHVWSRQRC